jgi:outer membrane protein assembly factor BamB
MGFLIEPAQSQVLLWGRNYISLIDVYESARWSININSTYGSPVVHWKNKMVYYRDSTPAVRAISLDTGAHIWSLEHSNLFEQDSNLLVDDENGGKLVVAIRDQISFISARTGVILHQYAIAANHTLLRMSASRDGKVIMTTLHVDEATTHWETQQVHCIDSSSGRALWVADIGSKGLNAFASVVHEEENHAYFVSNTDSFAISLTDGSVAWHHEEVGINLFWGDEKETIKYVILDFAVSDQGLVIAYHDASATYVKVVNKNGVVWMKQITSAVSHNTYVFVDAGGLVYASQKSSDNKVAIFGLDSVGRTFMDYETETSAGANTVALPFGLSEHQGCTAVLETSMLVALCDRE